MIAYCTTSGASSADLLSRKHVPMKTTKSTPPKPSATLLSEDTRLRTLAAHVVKNNLRAPDDLLWPYYQHELLKKYPVGDPAW